MIKKYMIFQPQVNNIEHPVLSLLSMFLFKNDHFHFPMHHFPFSKLHSQFTIPINTQLPAAPHMQEMFEDTKVVNRRRTDKAIVKRKRTNNNLQNTTKKTKD